jgi:2-dehydro-3-deoxyphosphogluconate aldolase/(4S)-4-hydroxy-2-oxoglutarate aldolase
MLSLNIVFSDGADELVVVRFNGWEQESIYRMGASMERADWLAILRQHRAIAILHSPSLSTGVAMAQAAVAGGFRLIEVTWNSDRSAALVAELRSALPEDCFVGVGTILTVAEWQAAIAAGAQFSFLPHTDPDLLHLGETHGIPVVPGALTPTEIYQAWQLGAWGIKVFPCQAVGGPNYVRQLHGPLGHIPLIPTGGVSVETGADYLAAGAIAVGLGSSLFPWVLVQQGAWDKIQARAHAFQKSLPPLSAFSI